MSRTLRLTAQAEADALQQSADPEVQHDQSGAASARFLAGQLAAERQRLETGDARYEQWAARTHAIRETAGKARAELQRRGHALPDYEPQAQPGDQPQATAGWWRKFDADLQAVERAIARQHRAAIDAGEPSPPQRASEPEPTPAPQTIPEDQPVPAQPEQDARAARLDALLARASQAAQHLTARHAERQASSEYAARIEREAQAQHEAELQLEAREGAEIKM